MTINLADNSPRISYAVAQGVTQTSFAVPFEFFADADLNVYVDGTLKTLTTHYTVSGGDGSTGTVTISVTGATGGSTVVITRDVALERTSDFPSSGPFQIGALNTELDRLTAIAADLDDKAGRALQLTDFDVAASLVLPTVDNRKGKTLAFNASSGAVEAGPTISDVQTVSAAAADIQTLAHIEDGTDATDAIQTVAGIASNVSTVAGVSSAVSTVAGISSNVTAVAADATDIGVVAGKATEIGRLGTAQAVADLDILATTDAVSDMNTLAAISSNISTVAGISANVTSVAGVASLITSDFVADLNTLATSDIVSDLNTLATADIVSDLNTLATSDIVSDLNTLATADIVSDLNTLATSDIVSDLNTLATTDIVTDLNLLATSAIVEDLNLLATSTVIADMATLAGAGANPNISSLGVSGNITLADNGKAIFGAGSDLQIYHDGSHSRILDSGTGDLYLQGNNLYLTNAAGNNYFGAISGGAASLYHNNALKLATTSTGVDITGTLTSDGLTVDTNTLHVDATNNRVGIGTSSPAELLNLSSAEPILRFTDSDDNNYHHLFSSSDDFYISADRNNTGSGNLILRNGGTAERMRIGSDGTLLVGRTAEGDSNVGHTFRQDGFSQTTRSGGLVADFNRLSSDGDICRFQKDGASVGVIGTHASNIIIGTGATGLRFYDDDNVIMPRNPSTGASVNGTISLGEPLNRFKDIHLSGSIEIENGTGNVSVGKDALRVNTASNNTAFGYRAAYSNTTSNRLVAIGQDAAYGQSTGSENTYVGYGSGPNTITTASGGYNVGIGAFANHSNSTGNNNTAVGYKAGYTNETGSSNVFVGQGAGQNTTSANNTFLGVNSGDLVQSGQKNTILGRYNGNQNGLDIRTLSNNIVLSDGDGNPAIFCKGSQDRRTHLIPTASNNNSLHIYSRSGPTATYNFIRAFSGATSIEGTGGTVEFLVQVNGNVQNTNNSYAGTSDEKLKENIVDANSQWEDIKALRVRKYSFKSDELNSPNQLGVIAQEVEAAGMAGLVETSKDQDPAGGLLETETKSVKYSILYMKAVKALQEAMDRIETLEAKVTALENA